MLQIRLKVLREKHGLSQYALAKKIGVGQSTVAMWEAGKNKPENASLEALADLFNVPTDYLLGRDCTTLPNEKEPTVDDDGLRAKAIERVQALSDPELVRVLDFLQGLEAGQEIESSPANAADPIPKSSE